MTKDRKVTVNLSYGLPGWLDLIVRVVASMVGYTIHGSLFWAIVDFAFWPVALVKWLVCQELNLTVLKETFNFLLN